MIENIPILPLGGPEDCQGTICGAEASGKCESCGKPICSNCARLKSWARGCCSRRQARKAYDRDISYGPISDSLIHEK